MREASGGRGMHRIPRTPVVAIRTLRSAFRPDRGGAFKTRIERLNTWQRYPRFIYTTKTAIAFA